MSALGLSARIVSNLQGGTRGALFCVSVSGVGEVLAFTGTSLRDAAGLHLVTPRSDLRSASYLDD